MVGHRAVAAISLEVQSQAAASQTAAVSCKIAAVDYQTAAVYCHVTAINYQTATVDWQAAAVVKINFAAVFSRTAAIGSQACFVQRIVI